MRSSKYFTDLNTLITLYYYICKVAYLVCFNCMESCGDMLFVSLYVMGDNDSMFNSVVANRIYYFFAGMSQVTARLNSKYADPSGNDPDIQLFFRGYTQRCTQNSSADAPQDPSNPDATRTLGISPVNLHAESRGYIALRSSDPFEAPVMVGNYLTAPGDIDVLVEGIRIIQNLTRSDTLVSKYGIQLQDTTYGDCAELNE